MIAGRLPVRRSGILVGPGHEPVLRYDITNIEIGSPGDKLDVVEVLQRSHDDCPNNRPRKCLMVPRLRGSLRPPGTATTTNDARAQITAGNC